MEKELLMQKSLAELKALAKGKIDNYYAFKKSDLVYKLIAYENSVLAHEKYVQGKYTSFKPDNTRQVFPAQENPDIESLEYPFSFILEGEYKVKNFIVPMPGELLEDAGDFPHNISQYLWVYPGMNDEEPWLALVKLDNGNYAFFRGECDNTGFNCQGSMELYVSKSLTTLVEMAMTNEDYRKYKESF